MIDRVVSIKGNRVVEARYLYTDEIAIQKWRCANCNRGVVFVWHGDNRLGFFQDRKKCKVCSYKFTVLEIGR